MKTASVAARLNRVPLNSVHRKAVILVGICFFFDLYESFLSGILAVALSKDFGSHAKSALLASLYLGGFVGVLIGSKVADRIGRRTALIGAIAWYGVFSVLGALAPSAPILIGLRALAGIGVGAQLPLGAVYLSEILPPAKRGKYFAVAGTIGFLGNPTAGLMGWLLSDTHILGVSGWRWMLGLGVIGTVIVVSLRKNLVESPRWLEAAGRQDDAVAAVNHFEAVARKEVGGLPKVEDEEIAVQRGKPKFWELLRGPLRKRMIMLWIFHLTQSVGYYGFGSMVPLILAAKGFSLSNNFLVTMLTYIGYPVGSALAIPIMERFQRKHLVVAAASGMVVCGLWFGMSSSWAWIAAAGFCYTIASNVFSNSYHIYESELFPTYVRATATMGVYSVSRLMSAAAPFLLVPLLDNVGVSAALSVVVIAMVVVIVDISILGPRTNGQTVEAIALGRPAREPARDKQAVR